jgi:thiosulfate/3-mercaptopyruvate sulfurtransferase
MSDIAARGYANPDVLVSTDWVAAAPERPERPLVESNEDTLLYPSGTSPAPCTWTGRGPERSGASRLHHARGLRGADVEDRRHADTTVVFYGDKNNWWATYAFWVFQLFGHTNAKIMDGGRLKWEKEGRELTRDVPSYRHEVRGAGAQRHAGPRVPRRSAAHVKAGTARRRPEPGEYAGTRLHMPDYPNEGALRGGHIPGAKSVPWAKAINPEDGTFKSAEELKSSTTTNRARPSKPTSSPTAASASAAATPGSR